MPSIRSPLPRIAPAAPDGSAPSKTPRASPRRSRAPCRACAHEGKGEESSEESQTEEKNMKLSSSIGSEIAPSPLLPPFEVAYPLSPALERRSWSSECEVAHLFSVPARLVQ